MPLFAEEGIGSAPSLDYRASHVSAYLLRRFRSLMPFVQLVNSVPATSHCHSIVYLRGSFSVSKLASKR
jgi:hypothetical protein